MSDVGGTENCWIGGIACDVVMRSQEPTPAGATDDGDGTTGVGGGGVGVAVDGEADGATAPHPATSAASSGRAAIRVERIGVRSSVTEVATAARRGLAAPGSGAAPLVGEPPYVVCPGICRVDARARAVVASPPVEQVARRPTYRRRFAR